MDIVVLSDKQTDGAVNIALLEHTFLSFELDFKDFDYLVFTSPRGVYSIKDYHKHNSLPCFVVGEKTKEVATNAGFNVVFVGNGYGDFLQNEIRHHPQKKFLFISGCVIASEIDKEPNVTRCIAYESHCAKKDLPSHPCVFVFTSPAVVRCFFSQALWDDNSHAIAIGKTTAKELSGLGISHKISQKPSIRSCVDLGKKIINE